MKIETKHTLTFYCFHYFLYKILKIETCCEIIVKENREGGERENSIIDILRGVIYGAPKGLFIAKG